MQFVARLVKHLPVLNLEVMTLAYTIMNVAMYAAWWAKPLDVSCPVRVPDEEVRDRAAREFTSVWDQIATYVVGDQDQFMDLRQCTQVPIFWAGEAERREMHIADVFGLLVEMVFGSVHCIARRYNLLGLDPQGIGATKPRAECFQLTLNYELLKAGSILERGFDISKILSLTKVASTSISTASYCRCKNATLKTPIPIISTPPIQSAQQTMVQINEDQRHRVTVLGEPDAQTGVAQLEFNLLHSSIAPILSLPEEVLAMMFEAGTQEQGPYFAVLVSHVTHSWRNIALATPRLWATIRSSPVKIYIGYCFTAKDLQLLQLLGNHFGRCQHFSIPDVDPEEPSAVLAHFSPNQLLAWNHLN
ncbi:hypothetical protein FIBSPDRAFT_1041072 [Athelia psychrophila]|uniref:F-box domain-containing protein n=1 Tax=Athelia psychrophila TaxID=1759441 RepID=A0A166PDY4_9AGAM|nr:hypothetical protein FIBSPDRAFT_1041072 [Fibularhizoctonia sp. CBS 109695]